MDGPSLEVRQAFGIENDPIPLAGGTSRSFLAGTVVFKHADDPVELEWIQRLTASIEADGFVLAAPVVADDGSFVHENWSASTFLDGLVPAAPDWSLICQVGRRFSAAATTAATALEPSPHRSHRWAVADRCAWDEEEVELDDPQATYLDRLRARTREHAAESVLIHGDLAGNVQVGADGTPAVLDITPYRRPAAWADAIVVADAVLWHDAPFDLAHAFASSPAGVDLLARALIFRLIAEQLADDPPHGAVLEPYERIIHQLDQTTIPPSPTPSPSSNSA